MGEGLVGVDEDRALSHRLGVTSVYLDELVGRKTGEEEVVEDLDVGPFPGGERADRPGDAPGLDSARHFVSEAGVVLFVAETRGRPGARLRNLEVGAVNDEFAHVRPVVIATVL